MVLYVVTFMFGDRKWEDMILNWIVTGVSLILSALGFSWLIFISYCTSRYMKFGTFSKYLQYSVLNFIFCHTYVGRMKTCTVLNFQISRLVSMVPYSVCVHVEYPHFHCSMLTSASFRSCCFSLSSNPYWLDFIVGY
jgi:hypothetical protein